MNRLSREKQTQVVAALVEGNSINSTVRMTGVAKHTILKLVADLGSACGAYQDGAFQNLRCKRIQCDEIWQFCYAKKRTCPPIRRANSATAMFGLGLQLMRTQSSFPPLHSAIGMPVPRGYSLRTWQDASRTASN